MSHYYTNDPTLKSQEISIKFKIKDQEFSLLSDRGVFSSKSLDEGSRYLIESLIEQKLAGHGLDLGCGNGVISLVLKAFNPELNLTLTDINDRALDLAKKNITLAQLDKVSVVKSNLFENIKQSFDFIYFNPPIRAGKKVIYQGFEQSYHHLTKNGRLFLVIRRDLGAESAIKELERLTFRIEILTKTKGYWVFVAHKSDLKSQENMIK